jgi:IS66 C-terminal element
MGRRLRSQARDSGHYGVASDGGGRTWATIATLLQTAKMNDVDPLAWLAQTLERIANRTDPDENANLLRNLAGN